MLDLVYQTKVKNLFCSAVILFLSFEGLYESLSKALFRCALGARARSIAFPGKACLKCILAYPSIRTTSVEGGYLI